MDANAAKTMADTGLGEWYQSLDGQSKRILSRYIGRAAEGSGPKGALLAMAKSANDEDNHDFALTLALKGLGLPGDEMVDLLLDEERITALVERNRHDEAREACLQSLERFPRLAGRLREMHQGKIPQQLACRNRLIDIVVGIEGDYETAKRLLQDFVDKGIMEPSELELRLNSLQMHRLQRSFDAIYTVRFKED